MTATSVTGVSGPGTSEGPLRGFSLDYIRKVFIKDGNKYFSAVRIEDNKYVLNLPSQAITSDDPIILFAPSMQCGATGDPRGNKSFDFQCCRDSNSQIAYGSYSFIAGGCSNTAQGTMSFACGYANYAGGYAAHAEGGYNYTSNDYAHAEGEQNTTFGEATHVEGSNNFAPANYAHAEGYNNGCFGYVSHVEGSENTTYGYASHCEGYNNNAKGDHSHCEGRSNYAYGENSHCEGYNNESYGYASHAEGGNTYAYGYATHTEGTNTYAGSAYAHAEGLNNTSNGYGSHTEGVGNTANGAYAHCEGGFGYASGGYSHTEGENGRATGRDAHAEGFNCFAYGQHSHAGGKWSTAAVAGQWARSNLRFTTNGDSQITTVTLHAATPDDVSRLMTFFDTNASGDEFPIAANKFYGINITIVAKKQGTSDSAFFKRSLLIGNNGGTTALVGAVQTIGTDINSPGWAIGITADNTADVLQVQVTGALATNIIWTARLEATEVLYT